MGNAAKNFSKHRKKIFDSTFKTNSELSLIEKDDGKEFVKTTVSEISNSKDV